MVFFWPKHGLYFEFATGIQYDRCSDGSQLLGHGHTINNGLGICIVLQIVKNSTLKIKFDEKKLNTSAEASVLEGSFVTEGTFANHEWESNAEHWVDIEDDHFIIDHEVTKQFRKWIMCWRQTKQKITMMMMN